MRNPYDAYLLHMKLAFGGLLVVLHQTKPYRVNDGQGDRRQQVDVTHIVK
jgi:hypothetical protein